jgi:hypothetical protein
MAAMVMPPRMSRLLIRAERISWRARGDGNTGDDEELGAAAAAKDSGRNQSGRSLPISVLPGFPGCRPGEPEELGVRGWRRVRGGIGGTFRQNVPGVIDQVQDSTFGQLRGAGDPVEGGDIDGRVENARESSSRVEDGMGADQSGPAVARRGSKPANNEVLVPNQALDVGGRGQGWVGFVTVTRGDQRAVGFLEAEIRVVGVDLEKIGEEDVEVDDVGAAGFGQSSERGEVLARGINGAALIGGRELGQSRGIGLEAERFEVAQFEVAADGQHQRRDDRHHDQQEQSRAQSHASAAAWNRELVARHPSSTVPNRGPTERGRSNAKIP